MSLQLADFTSADQDAVRSLILDGLAEHWGSVDPSRNPDLDDLAASYGHGRTIVVRDHQGVAATGTVVPQPDGSPQILRMSVRHDLRRQGLGRLVLDELVATARRWGASRVVLETTAAWAGTVRFYEDYGFTVTRHDDTPSACDTWFALHL